MFKGVVPKVLQSNIKTFDNGHWSFPEKMDKDNYVGFIYVIKDTYLERLYLGKKLYSSFGKVTRGQESNWKKYLSSSKVLAEHFKERPKSEFEFICIEQYQTKGTLSYSETWSLCFVEAPTNKTWYNTLIEKVSWNVKEKITDRHKERLNKILNWEKISD
jgi:hypothetical protein